MTSDREARDVRAKRSRSGAHKSGAVPTRRSTCPALTSRPMADHLRVSSCRELRPGPLVHGVPAQDAAGSVVDTLSDVVEVAR